MSNNRVAGIILIGIILGAFLCGLALGWHLYRPEVKAETYAPEKRLRDGALVLEKKPGAKAEADAIAPPPKLPAGKPERTVVVTVKPKPKPLPPAQPALPGQDGFCPVPREQECPPVRVRLDLVKLADDTRRVVASSPDGEIVGGLDVPLAPIVTARQPLWAAGVTMTHDRRFGGFIDRDMGPVRLGAEIGQAADAGLEFRVRAGIRF